MTERPREVREVVGSKPTSGAKFWDVAQWQSSGLLNRGLWVRLPPSQPFLISRYSRKEITSNDSNHDRGTDPVEHYEVQNIRAIVPESFLALEDNQISSNSSGSTAS